MSRRTIAIIIFIVGILMLAVVAVVFITSQNQPPEQVAPVDSTAVPGEEVPPGEEGAGEGEAVATQPPTPSNVVEVVVSLQTVPRGYLMTEDILTTELRDAATVDFNVITDIEDVVGQYARDDIFQGETLTFLDLVDDITLISGTDFGPSSIIPPGFVAQAIPLNQISSVGYGISEGDHVDIMLLFRMYELDQEFQTLLPNDAAFYLEEQIQAAEELGQEAPIVIYGIEGIGRFEELATGDLAEVGPNGPQRPTFVGVLVQNAKVIQVGEYEPPPPITDLLPTATPEVAEGEPTPTPPPDVAPTATPAPPSVVLLALQPQQQLLLRYALEVGANVDMALRNTDDGQLYAVDNVDLNFFLQRFNIEIPPNLDYTVDTRQAGGDGVSITPTPAPTEQVPEGG